MCFRQAQTIVIWDIKSCARLFQLDFQSAQAPSQPIKITSALFDKLNPDYILCNGEQALIVRVKEGMHHLESYQSVKVIQPDDANAKLPD